MGSRKNKLQEDTRFRVLRLLESNPEMSQRELADAVGISAGSAHYLIKALVRRGLVEVRNFKASGAKRRYAYVLTAKGLAEKTSITGRFLARKVAEYESLKHEISELETELDLPRSTLRAHDKRHA